MANLGRATSHIRDAPRTGVDQHLADTVQARIEKMRSRGPTTVFGRILGGSAELVSDRVYLLINSSTVHGKPFAGAR
jgi:hypothetical protein